MSNRELILWNNVLNQNISLKVMLNTLPTKGNLVYEYNPFRNYRLTSNKYWYKENYYTEEELRELEGITINPDQKTWDGVPPNTNAPVLYEKGLLVDFVTEDLKFSLKNPVHIVPLYSYDGSVNLILNDGLNIPRLINSRFSATGKNTYEIVDRKGSNDTNIYDLGELFDIDTSLYKIVNKIPKVKFLGTPSGGNLKVGNYHFYFKLADADGNETDFVAESGLVSVFIGQHSYGSVWTGNKNENSTKLVEFRLEDIDSAYDYIQVYYSRYTAENGENSVYEYKKINKKYSRVSPRIIITGFEDTEDIAVTDLNLSYNLVESVKTLAVCLNMLFMGNVKKQTIPYEELQDLSLRILPFLGEESYDPGLTEYYRCDDVDNSYIDPKFIYDKTGYWLDELYRFGIVYILPNGLLTPVFNVRGATEIGKSGYGFSHFDVNVKDADNNYKRKFIKFNENTNFIVDTADSIKTIDNTDVSNTYPNENVKGVCLFTPSIQALENENIYYVKFYIDTVTKNELSKYVKGFFFVRLARIPSILAQGITLGVDKISRTPTIPTCGGVLQLLSSSLDLTHVETEDINGINYISEGFLKRYSFTFKKKSSSLWGKIGKIVGTTVLIAAAVVATVYTAGIGGAAMVSIGGAIVGLGTSGAAITTAAAAAIIGGAAVVAGGATALVATGLEITQALIRIGEKKELKGRETKAPSGYKIAESEDSRKLSLSFLERIIIKDSKKNDIHAIICPDYTVNPAYYNQIFTGNEHLIKTYTRQRSTADAATGESYFDNLDRHFYIDQYTNITTYNQVKAKIIGVPDNVKGIGLDEEIFKARAGEAEEAHLYSFVGDDRSEDDEDIRKINTDIIRGSFGPYLACNNDVIGPAKIVNIYAPGYDESQFLDYLEIRMNDNSVYNAITDRRSIDEFSTGLLGDTNSDGHIINAYRGDCYICLFTLRINRNFNDPSAPYNDKFVKDTTWKDNYTPKDTANYAEINLGDLNAVLMGMWVTFLLRSSNNLNIRSLDTSNVDETAMTGHPRGYFPAQPMSVEGLYKTPESLIYNKGFAKSLSEKWNMHSPDVPHIKNWFGTRIMYSDIHINDGYKNGFRVFQGTNYRDYTREYGEIVKLVPFESSLLCVFEHGVALIPVNERAIAGQGTGGNVYINTSNVLPENPKIISDMFGSLWPESILKVPGKTGDAALYVYGVDTAAKKIWRTDGNSLLCISDFKVQEFLNNNITLGERELTPIIGVRNVKTHYNAFKRDVMFTFYDNTYGFEEKVWNLCWNELLLKFITFYSWVPSYMENINNIPFSFDRNTSKWIAKLGISHTESSFADGITLSNVVINNDSTVDSYKIPIKYIDKLGQEKTKYIDVERTKVIEGKSYTFIAGLSLSNRVLPNNLVFYNIKYDLERDNYGNHKMFKIADIYDDKLPNDAKFAGKPVKVQGLFFELGVNATNLFSELYYRNSLGHAYADYDLIENEDKSITTIKENKIVYNSDGEPPSLSDSALTLPIFKDITGKRPTLNRKKMLNPDKLVTLLNIKATIQIEDRSQNTNNLSDDYYNLKAGFTAGTSLIDAGYYESVVAVIPKWNMQFLSTDFWKHGQAGIIDIADDIKPTYWYGKQHPFEFEVVVVNDPAVHKIFDNLELVANKAVPESFHYEIIGECYDFAKDKVNMYFRQEAKKALWQYNGADICYDRNFLKVLPKLLNKSADLPHTYYARKDTINEIEDYYVHIDDKEGYDYRHLSGGEIVYYPNRLEYRIWNHAKAINLDDLDQDSSRSIITSNCQYLEDRWKVTINPILVCYKNEGKLWQTDNNKQKLTSWKSPNRPPLTIYNSPIPDDAYNLIVTEQNNTVNFPPILLELGYSSADIDSSNWLDKTNIYGTNFGEALNRKELDLKDRFIKIRIRYSGDELAIISFLNTIYRVSYS